MEFTRQLGVAAILVTGTLWLQSAGMAFLIHWARTFIARGIRGIGPWMSVVLMIRFTTAMVVLHILQIVWGQGLIAGCFFHHGSPLSIFRPAVIRPLDTGTLFSRKCGES